ncbi:hypothetical protein EDD86DRAFT_212452 [Gorgonomyces haynaldii]|nr:hypothetical protein EDD86DRAFT_212452 [Gorgonomyces haynaldii]
MIEKDGYVCVAKSVPSIDTTDFTVPPEFEWPNKDNENNEENTNADLEYLQTFIQDFKKLQTKKSIEAPHLNTTVGENPHHLNGKADLYVMPSACDLVCRNQLAMVFELKPNILTSANIAQAMGYMIAANSLFDIPDRPSPIGVLSDLRDQWVLLWPGNNVEICYAEKEVLKDGTEKKLARISALHYIRKHIKKYNDLLLSEYSGRKRKTAVASEPQNWAFGEFESGRLKKVRIDVEDNMLDVLETPEEIALYEMRKRMMMTPLFDIPPAAEHMSYFG